MIRRAALALLLAQPAFGLAADWIRVPTSDVHQHYYDRAKLGIDGDEITYWRRVTFKTPQPSRNGPAGMAMYRERIDCARHTHRTLGYLLYGQDGSMLENVYTPDAQPEPIVPETVGDKFEALMCVFVDQARSSRQAADAEGGQQSAAAIKAEIERLEARLKVLRERLGAQTAGRSSSSPNLP